MRLIFMGTPDFAVPSLKKLIASSHEILAVITVPDRPKGRGLKMVGSPVKQAALSENLTVLQPDNLKNPSFLNQLHQYGADCFVIVGFRILPPDVFEIPEKGSFNLHASLLPKYRGAAPIQWAIIQGEKETGVTTFRLKKKVDTGDIYLQEKIEIHENETCGELHDRLAVLGADLVLKTVGLIDRGYTRLKIQQGDTSPAPKITPEVCAIDWNKSAVIIHNQIRGLSPYPGAFTFWNSKRLKIYRSCVHTCHPSGGHTAGTVLKTDGKKLIITTGEDTLSVEALQIEGKRRMTAEEFLHGYPIRPGDCFQSDRFRK